ncbi:MAG: DUF3107 domain-containing protein [Actinomycetota bacterium]
MDVRIGIAESSQVIEVELDNDTDRDALKSRIESAVAGSSEVLWLTDRKGKDLAVPAQRIAFIELGTTDTERRIGFGA